ncbi:MAG: RNA polymerase sigma factor [Polyangiales bacterium]
MTFRELYDEHFDFVWRSLRRLGLTESDAPDAAQEVFVVVHRKLAEFEGRSKVTTWLFGICMRVASDRRRRASSRHEVLDGDGVIDGIPDSGPDAEHATERRQQRDLVERILDTLPMEQRAVFVLFELEELPGEEIASMLDIPTGTVHSRLRLARQAFRAELARLQAKERFRRAEGA